MRREWYRGRHGPPQFVRRMGCAFAALIVLAAIGASTLMSLLMRAPQQAFIIGGAAVIVLAVLVAGFSFSVRRVSHVFREQDRLRRQMMADVAHELRTPLSILQGRLEGVADGVYPADAARVAELLDQTRHLSRLVEDLRTLANSEAGALELRKERIDPAELMRDASSSFNSVRLDIPDDLPLIDIDPVRIREVLLNLLANAVRHTPEGGTVSLHAAVEGRRLIIRVRDTGTGIAPEQLPHIFERFHKGRDSHGSGLGLAIARNLVVAHGGQIRAESVAGAGTTITVALPFSG